MKIVFPYQKWYQSYLPMISFRLPQGQHTYALIDSGANSSLFDVSIARQLGINIEDGQRQEVTGIGGRIIAYRHIIPIRIGWIRLKLKVDFSLEYTLALNILGRDNFFREFTVTFDELKRQTILQRK